jgi:hypothetical protein
MKKLLLTGLLSLALVGVSHAQGTVTFKNFGSGANGSFATPARVTLEGVNLDGTVNPTMVAQLWNVSGGTPVALTPTVGFGSGVLAGTFAPSSSVAVPGVPAASVASLRVVVWDTATGADYASATTKGESNDFSVTLADSLAPSQPILIGMNGFNVTAVVPEPSVIMLGLAGAGLLWFRRKK